MTSSTELPRSARWFVFSSLAFTILSLSYSLLGRLMGCGLPYSYPYYLSVGTFFTDFNELALRFQHLGTPAFFAPNQYFMYPPAMVLPYAAIARWLPDPFHTFILVFLIAFVLLTVCFYLVLRRYFAPGAAMLLVASTAVTCYPFLLLIQRENMEVVSWTLITVGLWWFYRERFIWASICIGLATALKIYPLIFFGLFLPRRLYRELVVGIASCTAVTLLGLRVISPNIGFAYAWDKTQLGAFGRYYTTSMLGLGYDHSFFALVKCATLPWLPDLNRVLSIYTWTVVIGCLVLFFSHVWKLPLVNQIVALSVLSVAAPPASHEYTLLTLYVSLAVLCVLSVNATGLAPYFLLYAAILTPQSYVIVHGARYVGPIHAVLLLALLGLSLWWPVETSSGCIASTIPGTSRRRDGIMTAG